MPIQIISTGSSLPKRVVSNDDLSTFLDTSDEWISSRCGIKTRHIATSETTTQLGAESAKIALENSGLKANDIDLIICATITPDTITPMTAANIKEMLGIENAVAFDLNANCSGFVYAITVAKSLMETCEYKNALVIGADILSQIANWEDRSTCVLFGDGAGAVVLSNTSRKGILATFLDCLIDSDKFLSCLHRIDPTPFSTYQRQEGVKVVMNGSRVMRFAVKALTHATEFVAHKAGVQINDIKIIVPHQANARILASAASTLGIGMDKFYINIDKTGNTSAASVPIAFDEVVRQNLIQRGDLVLFVAFGGGLTSGAILFEW